MLLKLSKKRKLKDQILAEVTKQRITKKRMLKSLNLASKRLGQLMRSFMRKAKANQIKGKLLK